MLMTMSPLCWQQNQCDLRHLREVSTEEAKEYAGKQGDGVEERREECNG